MSALGPAETGWQELCGVMHAHGVALPFKAEGAELGHRLRVCHTAAKEEPGDAAACPSRAAPAAHVGKSQGQGHGQGQGPGSGAGGAATSAAIVAAARAELAVSQAAAASAAVDRETQVRRNPFARRGEYHKLRACCCGIGAGAGTQFAARCCSCPISA